jgi:histidine ammonia-lyase
VLAIELMTAARALDLRAPLAPSPATAAVVRLLREAGISGPGTDRFLAPDIDTAYQLVTDRRVTAAVAEVIGELA